MGRVEERATEGRKIRLNCRENYPGSFSELHEFARLISPVSLFKTGTCLFIERNLGIDG
ncbi:hypothetical protein Clim_1207 [Chlorobium limicola DSM 245]|uniref:Uncharacterized protein n=1 Tax=Chlorobium limicola (strain DSM 245 / NBRC 103803 / 6330) TaxID=290315 RepID=B3ECJ9_CHLL2|nr:hypothetical protein Clim_1207 [Chlorobium limicola DSM 245]